jgi:hypothetical protein
MALRVSGNTAQRVLARIERFGADVIASNGGLNYQYSCSHVGNHGNYRHEMCACRRGLDRTVFDPEAEEVAHQHLLYIGATVSDRKGQ